MTDRPVFIYEALYGSQDDAMADYDALLELHDLKLVGTYDAAIVVKNDKGKVHVHKHEKPTQHGAWSGIAAGALVGILFPPSVIGAAVVVGATGGVIGHLARGMSRHDIKELGELLDDGQAALVVVGESRAGEQLDKALTRAQRSIERGVDAGRQGAREGNGAGARGGSRARVDVARTPQSNEPAEESGHDCVNPCCGSRSARGQVGQGRWERSGAAAAERRADLGA